MGETDKRAIKDEVLELDNLLESDIAMTYADGPISEEDRQAIINLLAGYFWHKKQKEHKNKK